MVAIGTWIWLASNLMFFAALFAAYFNLRSITNAAAAGGHRVDVAVGVAHFNMPFAVTNTLILILSSVTCRWACGRPSVARSAAPARCCRLVSGACVSGTSSPSSWAAIFVGGQATQYATLASEGFHSLDQRLPRRPSFWPPAFTACTSPAA